MRKVLLLCAATALLPVAAITLPAEAATGPVPIATHLNNPRQLAFGPDGALYVAEAGSGKVGAKISGACFSGPEGSACSGDTASVTQIGHPSTATGTSARRVVTGLLSVAGPDGSGAVGVDAVTFAANGTPYGIMTYAPPARLPHQLAWQSGQLLTDVGGRAVPLSNVGVYSLAHPQPGHPPDSDPYGVAAVGKAVYIADAGGNSLLKFVNGKLTTVRVFRHRTGSTGVDSVPTSIAVGPEGLLYIGELGSLVPGEGRVEVVNPATGHIVRSVRGLTSVAAVAVSGNGTIYASEMFAGCAPGVLTIERSAWFQSITGWPRGGAPRASAPAARNPAAPTAQRARPSANKRTEKRFIGVPPCSWGRLRDRPGM
jgi:hypothetical protein